MTFDDWGNPLWERLLMWALRLPSPSKRFRVGGEGLVTFREAWTGRIYLTPPSTPPRTK